MAQARVSIADLLVSPGTLLAREQMWVGLALGTEEVSPSPREVRGCSSIQTLNISDALFFKQ